MSHAGVDREGRIVLAGWVQTQTGIALGIARLLPSGDLDPTFGVDGRVQLDSGSPYPHSVHALADGRILVGSYVTGSGAGLAAMLTSTGQLDPRFGDGGIFRQAAAGVPTAVVVATNRMLLDGEHLYMIGSNAPSDSGNRDFAASRYVLPLFRNGFE